MSRVNQLFALAAAALFGTAAVAPISAVAKERDILFGIVPQQSATRLAQVWVPVMNRLAKETGLSVRFATAKDIPTFERCLTKGAYELAYMNPYHYTVYHELSGYQAFAKQTSKRLQGLIVVRKENPASGLRNLDGKSFAFPSPAAFGASVLPQAEMKSQGIRFTATYVKSHDSVYRSVAAGMHDAGGGVKRTFGNIPHDLRDQLRVIYTTEAYTPHAFAILKTLPAEKAEKIVEAMVTIVGKEEALMKPLGMKGIEAATDANWDDVRALGLSKAQTRIEDEGDAKCRFD